MSYSRATGKIDAILSSCTRFAQKVSVLDAHKNGALAAAKTIRIGPPKVFGRIWEQAGLNKVIKELLKDRKYEFDVERAIFLTVLHRLMVSGSDRNAEQWCRGYAIDGIADIELHQMYRAMAWLGEELAADNQFGATPFSPRCIKDLVEESLFARRRNLFDGLDLVFFDTTSIYFEGEGGETIGQHGISKDSRPDLKQMVVGAVLDGKGIFHKCDETIRGHVFCSFLALILMKDLHSRMADRGWIVKWERLKDDLDNLQEITVQATEESFVIRSETRGDAGKAIQAAGVALGR